MSRVHKVHTLNPGCAHCAQVMRTASCGSTRWHVVWQQPPPPPPPPVTTKKLCHDQLMSGALRELCRSRSACRVTRAALRVAVLLRRIAVRFCTVSQPCYALLRHKRSPTATIQTIVSRLTPSGQAMRARCHSPST